MFNPGSTRLEPGFKSHRPTEEAEVDEAAAEAAVLPRDGMLYLAQLLPLRGGAQLDILKAKFDSGSSDLSFKR